MLQSKNRRWFRACAAGVATLTLWFALGMPTVVYAAGLERRAQRELDDTTRQLGLSSSGETTAEIAKRRARALERLRALSAPRADAIRKGKQVAAEVRAAHLPALLGGAARAVDESARAARLVREARDDRERERALRSLESARAAVDRGLAEAAGRLGRELDGRLGPALDKARRLERMADGVVRSGHPAGAAEVERLAPAKRRGSVPGNEPSRGTTFIKRAPRERVKLGEAATPETREMYASFLDAPGLEVETDAGLADAAMVVAGGPVAPRLAATGLPDLGSLLGTVLEALPPPEAADLAETADAPLTPMVRAQAAALGGDPLAIYNFVHDELEAEPYYGAKKGGAGALAERSGNDADLSALLVALLRASSIPARYEYGTVDLTPAQAMAWTGTTHPQQAADVLATAGFPTTALYLGAEVSAVRVEHVWVRAWVPYSNYRGQVRPGSRAMWIRLDPTVKRAAVRSALDLRASIPFDLDGYLARVSGETPLQHLEQQIRGYVVAQGLVCRTLDEAIPLRDLVPDRLTLLPAELPSRLVGTLATFAGFPQAMRYGARVAFGARSVQLWLPSLYGQGLTVRYRGATPADEQAIAAAGGISGLRTPALVQVVPVLSTGGTELLRGEPVMPGSDQEMTVSLAVPHGDSPLVRHALVAGGVFALGFPVGVVPDSVVQDREREYRELLLSGRTGDDLEAARGSLALWRYAWHVDREVPRLLGYHWLRTGRTVGELLAGRKVNSDLLYGTPVAIRPGMFIIDAALAGWNPYSVDQNRQVQAAASLLSLYHASAWEHLVWEETVHVPAVSTVRVMQAARQQGLAILTLDGSNAALLDSLPYSAATKEDVRSGLHAGRIARIPERPVTWASYAAAEGYALIDPPTGSASMRLAGLYNGGGANGSGPAEGNSCPPCSGPDAPAGSTVSLASGAMRFAETDLTVPARGIPVAFTRRYDSSSPYGGRLGPGWQHSYEVRIVEEPGAAVLVNDAFQAQRFARNADGSYARPAGYHETLTATADGWTLAFKDGFEYRFRTDGQLASVRDTNGHAVTLEYDAQARLATVRDASGRAVLTFSYGTANLLASVQDLAGRSVGFGYSGGDLTSATDVLGQPQTYGYDSAHRLTSKTDKNGNTTVEMYDADGRWIGSREPDGKGRSVAYDWVNRRAVHVDKRGETTIWELNAQGNPVAVTDPLGNRRTMEWDADHNKVAEVDARGNRTAMTFDGDGNLLTRVDPLGATTTYTYDARGRVLTATDAAQHTTTNTYDARGNLETTTDAALQVTRYAYTADGLPEVITQPGGAVTRLAYESDGKVQSITDAENGTTTLGYDANGHLNSIRDALTAERRLVIDAAGRVRSMTDAANATTTFEYDPQGNRLAVVDAERNRTGFAYDALGRLTAVTDARSGVTRTEYDAEGLVTARIDPRGFRTEYRYDAAGRLVAAIDAAGNETSQAYCADVSTQACGTVDALGNLTEVAFDELGRPTVTTDARGRATRQHYDTLGRRDWSEDAAGRRTSYGYDGMGRLETVTDPAGGITRYGYDERGNRVSVTDANQKVTRFTYDLANRLRTEVNPLLIATTYEYDAAGNRRYKTDGNGQRTEYQYDANRRLRRAIFADGTSYDYDYDARGNRTLERSPSHLRTTAYDELGRPRLTTDHTLGRTIEYGYDAAGNRERMSLDTGEVVRYRWDGTGRLAELTDPDGQATRFEYDAAGRRKAASYGNGTSASWSYDAVGQVLGIVYRGADGSLQTAFGYGYDTAGNREYKRFADGREERYGYDVLDRLTSAEYPNAKRVEYGYDAVGNRTWKVDGAQAPVTRWAVSAVASSSYYPGTGLGTPAQAVGAPNISACSGGTLGAHWSAAFDSWSVARQEWLELTYAQAERAVGVRVHETNYASSVNRVDLIEEDGTSHTVYEGGDTTPCGAWLEVKAPLTSYRVKKVRVWTKVVGPEAIDAVGLLVPDEERYTYNDFNQLTGVTSASGATTAFGYDGNGNQVSKTETPAGGAAQLTQYVYDADNRLVGIALPNGGSNAFGYDANGLRTRKTDSSGATSYLLDGMSIVAQYAPDGSRQAWYTQSLARIDEVLSVVNSQGKHWYQADALGSIYTLTTAAGDVRARGGYDVFGAPVAEAGPAVGQPFGFTGREHEVEAGLVYARARYLNPGVGRWDRADPMGLIDGPNRYAYVGNGVTGRTDPTGEFFITPVIAGALLGGLFAGATGYMGGLRGWDLLQNIGLGAVNGAVGALPLFSAKYVLIANVIANVAVAALTNLFAQSMTWLSTGKGLDLNAFLAVVLSATVAGVVQGLFAPGSKMYQSLMRSVQGTLQEQWQMIFAGVMFGGMAGGMIDVVLGYWLRQDNAMRQAFSEGGELECLPV